MGIIGFGRIGQVTGRIAKAMGMKVLAYDNFESERPGVSPGRGRWRTCSRSRTCWRCTAR